MADGRIFLPDGTKVKFDNGDIYEIVGEPTGCGGGSILYSEQKLSLQKDVLQGDSNLIRKTEEIPDK